MTIDQLYYFISAMEEDTFFSAAERCHITQSTLSKQMMKLEQELDILLWDRRQRQAIPTEAGDLFYKQAVKLIQQYKQMITAMAPYQNAAKKEVHIGALPILLQQDIAEKLSFLIHSCPELTLTFHEAEEQGLLSGLEHGTFDLIIARESLVNMPKFILYPFAADELAVVLPAEHPAARAFLTHNKPFHVCDLDGKRLLLMHSYTSVSQCCMHTLTHYHLHPEAIQTARIETILSMVTLENCIGLIPLKTLPSFRNDQVVAVPIAPSIPLDVVFACKKHRPTSDAVRRVLGILKKL